MTREQLTDAEARLVSIIWDLEHYLTIIQALKEEGKFNGIDENSSLEMLVNRLASADDDLRSLRHAIREVQRMEKP